jgi:hypothetical protein
MAYVSDFEDGVYILQNNASTGIDEEKTPMLPGTLRLEQNYPNPFNPVTTIAYHLPAKSSVQLTIYNLAGQKIRTLVQAKQAAGTYRVTWDGCNQLGEPVNSGMYIYRLQTQEGVRVKKMLLLR